MRYAGIRQFPGLLASIRPIPSEIVLTSWLMATDSANSPKRPAKLYDKGLLLHGRVTGPLVHHAPSTFFDTIPLRATFVRTAEPPGHGVTSGHGAEPAVSIESRSRHLWVLRSEFLWGTHPPSVPQQSPEFTPIRPIIEIDANPTPYAHVRGNEEPTRIGSDKKVLIGLEGLHPRARATIVVRTFWTNVRREHRFDAKCRSTPSLDFPSLGQCEAQSSETC